MDIPVRLASIIFESVVFASVVSGVEGLEGEFGGKLIIR